MVLFAHRKSRMKRLISVYLDGQMDQKRVGLLEAHIEACEECRGELAAQRELSSLLGTALGKEETPDILPDVLSALRGLRSRESHGIARMFGWALKPALAYAAAAAFGITSGVMISSSLGTTTTAAADPLPIQYLSASPPNSFITLYYGETGEAANE